MKTKTPQTYAPPLPNTLNPAAFHPYHLLVHPPSIRPYLLQIRQVRAPHLVSGSRIHLWTPTLIITITITHDAHDLSTTRPHPKTFRSFMCRFTRSSQISWRAPQTFVSIPICFTIRERPQFPQQLVFIPVPSFPVGVSVHLVFFTLDPLHILGK